MSFPFSDNCNFFFSNAILLLLQWELAVQTYLADIKLYDFFCYFGEEKQNKKNNEVSK
jgi:hypothetical protein